MKISPIKFWVGRVVLILTFFVGGIIYINKAETARFELMSPEQQAAYKLEKEKENRKKQEKQNRIRMAEENELRIKENALKEKEMARKIEQSIDFENINQRDFFEKLGPPKILYKCDGDRREKALGAKFGTYNRLLEEATTDCNIRGSGLDIVDYEK